MCRLLSYVSDSETNFPKVVGKDFQEFVQLSKVHCDGWGITDKNGEVFKEATPAYESKDFMSTLEKNPAQASLLHLRWATSNLPVNRDNAHPFHYGEYSFIHNGSITPPTSIDPFISPEYLKLAKTGNDSERYFLLVVEKMKELGDVQGVKAAVKVIKENTNYSSINAMLMTPEQLIIINEHDNSKRPDFGTEDYYDLLFKKDGHSIVVGSSGWNQNGWEKIENHTIMVINRKSQAVSFEKI